MTATSSVTASQRPSLPLARRHQVGLTRRVPQLASHTALPHRHRWTATVEHTFLAAEGEIHSLLVGASAEASSSSRSSGGCGSGSGERGTWLACGGELGTICVWSLSPLRHAEHGVREQSRDVLRGHRAAVLQLAHVGPARGHDSLCCFCSASKDRTIRLWSYDASRGTHAALRCLQPGHRDHVRAVGGRAVI